MSTLSWKVRIAVIWAIGPMLHVAHLLYFTRVEDWGKYQGDVVLQSTVLLLLPLTFCVLSLTLKDKPNRWVNIIAGIFFAFLSYPVAWLDGKTKLSFQWRVSASGFWRRMFAPFLPYKHSHSKVQKIGFDKLNEHLDQQSSNGSGGTE